MKLSEAMEVSSEEMIKKSDSKNLSITTCKTFLENESSLIDQKLNRDNINKILNARTKINDIAVIKIAEKFFENQEEYISVIAIGGYGRKELYPFSDTDLLILIEDRKKKSLQKHIREFLTFLWDVGIEVSHSTRSLNECIKEGKKDVSVATSLIESRYLYGSEDLFKRFLKKINKNRSFWKNERFLKEKILEQNHRHLQFNNTAYNLEPNIKNGPGGLRDLHNIFWIAKKAYSINSIEELENLKILTKEQVIDFKSSWALLSRIRYSLHKITNRSENRLLFDYQRTLASEFGYKDQKHLLAVEVFMQDYYKAAKSISRLNEISLQILKQKIIRKGRGYSISPFGEFEVYNNLIGLKKDISFSDNPSLLLEIFVWVQIKHEHIEGIQSDTINQIIENLDLINNSFRNNAWNRTLFLNILTAPKGVTHELKRMNLYGVLGLYIPSFGKIEGRMQYDLFHAFTVDEHTLNVVSNLRRLALTRFDHEYPDDSIKMQSIEKQEILYIAGLYHDIAKGRGGDHSTIGAEEAEKFCLDHGLTNYDSKLVSWLVKNHLVFSLTAQKKDIYDPHVIEEFSKIIGDESRLDYLYLLTVSDVRATNPSLWNSWKERLFNDLYRLTKNSLRTGLENPIDKKSIVREKKELAKEHLLNLSKDKRAINGLLEQFKENYFLKFNQDEINNQMGFLLNEQEFGSNLDLINLSQSQADEFVSIFVLTDISNENFFLITSVLEEKNLSIRDAKVVQLNSKQCIFNFYIDYPMHEGGPFQLSLGEVEEYNLEIKSLLIKRLDTKESTTKKKNKPLPRKLRSFETEIQITFLTDTVNKRTVMELVCLDRPGLLLDISKVFKDENIWIESAKIATIGERAEDVFYLRDNNQEMISEKIYPNLEESLRNSLAHQ